MKAMRHADITSGATRGLMDIIIIQTSAPVMLGWGNDITGVQLRITPDQRARTGPAYSSRVTSH